MSHFNPNNSYAKYLNHGAVTREVIHAPKHPQPLDVPMAFKQLHYSAYPEDGKRLAAQPVETFATLSEAEDYALECANKDPGHFYHVRDLGAKVNVFSCKLPKGE